MTTSKLLAYLSSGLIIVLNLLQVITPVLPEKYQALATAILGIFAGSAFLQSHTPSSLASAGYVRD